MNSKNVRLSLDVSPELNQLLEEVATQSHTSKSDVLRKSIVLFDVAVREKSNGNHLGIFNNKNEIIKEIVGL